MIQRVAYSATVLVSTLFACEAFSMELETVRVSSNNDGFILSPSGARFVPWGHNYASVDILKRMQEDPARVARDFAEMKAAGTNVARVHPEMPRLLLAEGKVDQQELDRFKQLVKIAEESGIHLKVTGLACYRISHRLAWYDALDEQRRWQTQAFFWETIAQACAKSPAVFAYDLINEPAVFGTPEDGWYTGRMGEFEFCQRLSLNPDNRKGADVFTQWTKQMVDAIRKHDQTHLITIGMLPFPNAYAAVVDQLDFVSPHLYPESEKVDREIELLMKFDWGKPIVIGETFPLKCSADELQNFLVNSREHAHGWIGHWPDKSPVELTKLKQSGEATIEDAIWLSWTKLFQSIGPQMTGDVSETGAVSETGDVPNN